MENNEIEHLKNLIFNNTDRIVTEYKLETKKENGESKTHRYGVLKTNNERIKGLEEDAKSYLEVTIRMGYKEIPSIIKDELFRNKNK